MASKTTFMVQAFVMKRGRLAPGDRDVAPSDNGAIKRAKAWSERCKGAIALKIVADDDTGEVSEAVVLEQFGEMPDDFLDQLRGH